jgi:hypothetical protein
VEVRKQFREKEVRGSSMVAHLTAMQRSRVLIRLLPSPRRTLCTEVGSHLGWHSAVGWMGVGVRMKECEKRFKKEIKQGGGNE